MDNFLIDVVASGDDTLLAALRIAFSHNAPGGKATHWRCELRHASESRHLGLPKNHHVLVFVWHDEEQRGAFPAPLDVEGAFEMAKRWLAAADYGPEPDHDGSNSQGFRVFCEEWGHVLGHQYGIVGIAPAWAMHGK